MLSAGSVLVLGTVLAGSADPQLGTMPLRTCGAVAVTSPDRPKVRERFSARRTLDLQFRVHVRKADEDAHVVSLRVYTPKGHLYQELQMPYRVDPGRQRRGAPVTARFPIAGTSITTSGLYGRWRVTPHLDGSRRPCGAAAAFSIVQ